MARRDTNTAVITTTLTAQEAENLLATLAFAQAHFDALNEAKNVLETERKSAARLKGETAAAAAEAKAASDKKPADPALAASKVATAKAAEDAAKAHSDSYLAEGSEWMKLIRNWQAASAALDAAKTAAVPAQAMARAQAEAKAKSEREAKKAALKAQGEDHLALDIIIPAKQVVDALAADLAAPQVEPAVVAEPITETVAEATKMPVEGEKKELHMSTTPRKIKATELAKELGITTTALYEGAPLTAMRKGSYLSIEAIEQAETAFAKKDETVEAVVEGAKPEEAKPVVPALTRKERKAQEEAAKEAAKKARAKAAREPVAPEDRPNVEAALATIPQEFRARLRSKAENYETMGNPPRTQARLVELCQKWHGQEVEKVKAEEAAKAEAAHKAAELKTTEGIVKALGLALDPAKIQSVAVTPKAEAPKGESKLAATEIKRIGNEVYTSGVRELIAAAEVLEFCPSADWIRKNSVWPEMSQVMDRALARPTTKTELLAALEVAFRKDRQTSWDVVETKAKEGVTQAKVLATLRGPALQQMLEVANTKATSHLFQGLLFLKEKGGTFKGFSPKAMEEFFANPQLISKLGDLLRDAHKDAVVETAKKTAAPVAGVSNDNKPAQPAEEKEAKMANIPVETVIVPEVAQEPAKATLTKAERKAAAKAAKAAEAPQEAPGAIVETVSDAPAETPKVEEVEVEDAKVEETKAETKEEEAKRTFFQSVDAFFARQKAAILRQTDRLGNWVAMKAPKQPVLKALPKKQRELVLEAIRLQPGEEKEGEKTLFVFNPASKKAGEVLISNFFGTAILADQGEKGLTVTPEALFLFALLKELGAKRGVKFFSGIRKVKNLPGAQQSARQRAICDFLEEEMGKENAFTPEQIRVLEAIKEAKPEGVKKGLKKSSIPYHAYRAAAMAAMGIVRFKNWTALPFRAAWAVTGGQGWNLVATPKGEKKAGAKARLSAAWDHMKTFVWLAPKGAVVSVWNKLSSLLRDEEKAKAAKAAKEAKAAAKAAEASAKEAAELNVMEKSLVKANDFIQTIKAEPSKPIASVVVAVAAGVTAAALGAGVLLTTAAVVVGAAAGWMAVKAVKSAWGWAKGLFKKGEAVAAPETAAAAPAAA